MNRQDALAELKKNPEVSVLIVGGGINGIGTFRDLALNGVDVLLVERNDFCSGASSASIPAEPATPRPRPRPTRASAASRTGLKLGSCGLSAYATSISTTE